MSLIPTVQGLLDLVERAGHQAEADRERAALAAREWRVGPDDVGRLSALLTKLAARTTSTPEAPPERDPPPPAPSSWPAVLAPEAPFLDAIPRGGALLEGVERLLGATDFEGFRNAVAAVFVDILAYTPRPIDLTDRVGRSTEFRDVRVVAEHDDFRILVVCMQDALAMSSWTFRATRFEACFRLAPRAILWVFDPGTRHIRVVYRAPGSGGQPRWCALSAPWFVRDPADTLVGWVYRLSRCRPNLDDDGRRLHDRLSAMLHARPGELAADWSAPLGRVGSPAGLPWHQASTALTRRLGDLDHHCTVGIRWICRHLFPAVLVHEAWELDLVAIHAGRIVDDERCWKEARSSTVEVQLEVALRPWSGATVDTIRLRASLPIADERGLFWINGEPWRFEPVVDEEGRLVRTLTGSEDETAADDVDDVETDTALDEEPDDPTEDPEVEALWKTVRVQGAAVDQTLAWLAERRLSFLLRTIARAIRATQHPTAGDVLAQWVVNADADGVVPLVPPKRLREVLVPEGEPWRTRPIHLLRSHVDQIPAQPPAWSCPEVSSDLEPGAWAVIAGARLHPFGGLAVPMVRDGETTLRLEHGVSALWVNPRFADGIDGPRRWWIAHGLESLADAPGGSLRRAAAIAMDAQPARGVRRVEDPTLRWAVADPEAIPIQPTRTMRLWWDVPATERQDCPVTIAVRAGDHIRGGRVVACVARSVWAAEGMGVPAVLSLVRRAGLASLDVEGPWDEQVSLRAPWAGDARVLRTGLAPRVGHYGVVSGWRLWLEVAVHLEDRGEIISSTGDCAPLAPTHSPEETPWEWEDAEPSIWVPGRVGHDALPVFSGSDGELLLAESDPGACHLPAPVRFDGERSVVAISGDRLPDGRPVPRWKAWWLRALGHPMAQDATERQRAVLSMLPSVLAASPCPPRSIELPNERKPSSWTVPRLLVPRCMCGLRTGDAWLGHRCPACHEEVVPRDIADPPRAMALPTPVVHPWRLAEAAAVLGLLEHELEQVLASHPPHQLLDLLAEAAKEPAARARARCGLPTDHPRALRRKDQVVIGAALARATDYLDEFGPHAFRLDAVPVPPRSLLPIGAVPGAANLVSPPLDRALGQLRAALDARALIRRLDQRDPREQADIHLQRVAQRVMGPCGAAPGTGTVAAVLAALQPWRSPDQAVDLVGREAPLRRRVGECEAVFWEDLERTGAETTWLETDGALLELPRAEGARQPCLPAWWQRAAVNSRFLARTLPRMAAILAEAGNRLDDREAAQRALAGLADLVLDPSVDVGPWNVDAGKDRSVDLPEDAKEALESVERRFHPRLSGGGPPRLALRTLWCRLSVGWWTDGLGWVWSPNAPPDGVGWRRTLPELGSPVWEIWSTVRALVQSTVLSEPPPLWSAFVGLSESPWLDADSWSIDASPVTHGVDASIADVAFEPHRVSTAPAAPQMMPEGAHLADSPTDEEVPQRPPDIRYWESSVRQWLRRTG